MNMQDWLFSKNIDLNKQTVRSAPLQNNWKNKHKFNWNFIDEIAAEKNKIVLRLRSFFYDCPSFATFEN